jgi:hypothetical protein
MWTWLLSKLKAHWPLIAVAVVCLLGGIGIGWGVKPAVVETHEVTNTVTVEKKVVDQQAVEAEVERRVKEITATLDTHTEKTVVTTKDGTKTEKTVTDTHAKDETKDTTDKTQTKVVTVVKEVQVDHTVTVEKTVKPVLAQWHVGVLVGVAPRFDAPTTTPIMVGLEAERRIVGPVFAGAWVMAGSPVVGGFNVTNAAVGLKVGFEF